MAAKIHLQGLHQPWVRVGMVLESQVNVVRCQVSLDEIFVEEEFDYIFPLKLNL